MPNYLDITEYDKDYFNPDKPISGHPAGYSRYQKWYRVDASFSGITGSLGEHFADKAQRFAVAGALNQNHLVMELGAGKGYIVETLRNVYNYDAWGMDASPYAISGVDPSISGFVYLADARTGLAAYSNNSIDFIYTDRFLECVPTGDLNALVDEMDRASKTQWHIIGTSGGNTGYYTTEPISWWATGFNWEKGTRLFDAETLTETRI